MFAILAAAILVVMTPVLTVNKLLYPLKIDSSLVSQQQIAYEKGIQSGLSDSEAVFLYSPSQLNLNYVDVNYSLSDSVILRGWLVRDTLRRQSPLLLIIPDISEGAINYLPVMKQFSDRGFNVCVINMRGQGNSEGFYYDFTFQAAKDIIEIVSEIKKLPFVDYVAILGNSTGAAIALKAVSDSSSIADVLILQNPPKTLAQYFNQQAVKEWGNFIVPVLPAMQRCYEQQTGINFGDYDYLKMVQNLFVPHMMVASNFFSKKIVKETVAVYHASNYYRKQLFIDNASFGKATGFENSKKYYDRISAFINSSLSSKTKKTRFRKLAIN